jgi:crotonobetaine/carnitine-CoA ligase
MTVHPPWFDPRMPARAACVTTCLVDRHAAARPDKEFIRFEDGQRWTWAETQAIGRRTAAAFQARGVKPGDTVLAWLPNNATMVRTWLGANYAGAIFVPINAGYRGRLLEHVLATSRAEIMICHPQLAERLADVATARLSRVIVEGRNAANVSLPLTVEAETALDGDPQAFDASHAPQLWDTQMIIFTSGTTGPSKAVQATYLHMYATAQATYGYMTADDRMLINLPMYHVGGTASFLAAVAAGGSVALFDGFNTREFWSQVRGTGATIISGLIGAMTVFLSKNEPRPDDADNPLRMVTLAPINADTIALGKRYGFSCLSGFNMTELSGPLITRIDETVERSCGKPRAGVQCRLVDDHDIEVPVGAVGELIVRSDRPWDQFTGYYGDPEATAAAMRNGWFHTGDLMTRDADGNFFFVDRKKDAIRRRGENVSSIEVEIDVASFPAVREVAAYGVPSPAGEEEVMIAVAPKPGASIDPVALIKYLTPRMAHFMVPRYVRVESELPKTPTNKIQKAALRAQGITPGTWDREAAGLTLKRERLA